MHYHDLIRANAEYLLNPVVHHRIVIVGTDPDDCYYSYAHDRGEMDRDEFNGEATRLIHVDDLGRCSRWPFAPKKWEAVETVEDLIQVADEAFAELLNREEVAA